MSHDCAVLSHSVVSDSWPPPGDFPNPGIKPRSPALQVASLPAEPPGKPKNTGVGSISLLQWIFLTQGSNPSLPHCKRILYQLSHKGSPRILEWVAYPFSSRSSWPRNWTRVSCILYQLRYQGSPGVIMYSTSLLIREIKIISVAVQSLSCVRLFVTR